MGPRRILRLHQACVLPRAGQRCSAHERRQLGSMESLGICRTSRLEDRHHGAASGHLSALTMTGPRPRYQPASASAGTVARKCADPSIMLIEQDALASSFASSMKLGRTEMGSPRACARACTFEYYDSGVPARASVQAARRRPTTARRRQLDPWRLAFDHQGRRLPGTPTPDELRISRGRKPRNRRPAAEHAPPRTRASPSHRGWCQSAFPPHGFTGGRRRRGAPAPRCEADLRCR